MISSGEALDLAEKLENSKINIKNTIEKSCQAGYLGEKHFYASVIKNGNFTYTVPEILGDRYKSMDLDNNYFDILSRALDDEGIYISLAYANPNIEIPDEFLTEVYEYEKTCDDYSYLLNYALVTSVEPKLFKIYQEEGIAGPNRTEDFGIVTKIIDGEYKTYFAVRSTDMCMSTFSVHRLTDRYSKEHAFSFKNPLNRMLVEMMWNVIEFEE